MIVIVSVGHIFPALTPFSCKILDCVGAYVIPHFLLHLPYWAIICNTFLIFDSTFANQHLNDMDDSTLAQYDKLINQPSNDWELYYWMTEAKPTPEEFDGPVMDMLKRHAKNENMDVRIRQPDLKPVQEWP